MGAAPPAWQELSLIITRHISKCTAVTFERKERKQGNF